MKLKITALCLLAVLGGCTTAGPYVTNISSDGRRSDAPTDHHPSLLAAHRGYDNARS